MEAFGEHIRRLRTEQKLSLRSCAKKVGVSPSYLSRVEHGEEKASTYLIRKLAVPLGVDFEKLMVLAGRVSEETLDVIKSDPGIPGLLRVISERGLSAEYVLTFLPATPPRYMSHVALRLAEAYAPRPAEDAADQVLRVLEDPPTLRLLAVAEQALRAAEARVAEARAAEQAATARAEAAAAVARAALSHPPERLATGYVVDSCLRLTDEALAHLGLSGGSGGVVCLSAEDGVVHLMSNETFLARLGEDGSGED